MGEPVLVQRERLTGGRVTDLLHASPDPAQVVRVGVAGRSLGQQVLKVAVILGQPLYLQ